MSLSDDYIVRRGDRHYFAFGSDDSVFYDSDELRRYANRRAPFESDAFCTYMDATIDVLKRLDARLVAQKLFESLKAEHSAK